MCKHLSITCVREHPDVCWWHQASGQKQKPIGAYERGGNSQTVVSEQQVTAKWSIITVKHW